MTRLVASAKKGDVGEKKDRLEGEFTYVRWLCAVASGV